MDLPGELCHESVLSAMLERLRVVVWVLDADGVCVWVSPSSRSVLGQEPDDLVGTRPDLGSTNGPHGYRRQVVRGGGEVGWVESSVDSLRDDPGGFAGSIITIRDVSDEVIAEQRLAATLESGLEPHVYMRSIRDEGGRVADFVIEEANHAAHEYLHRAPGTLRGTRLSALITAEAAAVVMARYADVVESGEPLLLDDQPFLTKATDSALRFDIRAVKVGDGLSVDWRDVTRRYQAAQELAASEEHFRVLAESVGDVVRAFDLQGIHQWVSPSVEVLLGYRPEDLIGRSAWEIMHPDDRTNALRHGVRTAAEGGTVTAPRRTRLLHADGHWVWTETTNSFRYGPDGHVLQVYSVSRDAEAQVRAEMELQRMAQTDQLTGLLNRASILKALGEAMEGSHGRIAVLFCDVDGLKQINDSFGHAAGDAAIVAAARRCQSTMGADALVGRFGGDELLIVLPDVADLSDAVEAADRLRMVEPVGADMPTAGLSVGVTLVRAGDSLDQVIARADAAMYRAKSTGRNTVVGV